MDRDALRALLDSDARYNAFVRSGNNTGLVQLLNEVDGAAPKRWRPIPVEDFLDALAGESLTAAQEERVRTYTANSSTVPVHKAGVRAWIQAQGFAPATIQALRDLAEADSPHCVSVLGDDDERVGLLDVRQAVRQIAKSLIVSTGQV